MAVAQAAATVVGNSIGSSDPQKAKTYGRLAVSISLCLNFVIAPSIIFFRRDIAKLYT